MRLLICGDFVCRHPEVVTLDKKVREIFDRQDFVAVNFEAPVYGHGKDIPKSGPSLTQSPESPALLASWGVNVALLANNHMMDKDREGCLHTIEVLKKNGVANIAGVGNLNQAFQVLQLEKDGTKVGILNVTHREFGALDIDAAEDDYGTAWINHPMVNRAILHSKEVCDFLIVIPHAGVEDLSAPLPEWRARYREIIDLGADMVIGSHPHTPQGVEEYDGKKIYHSLGNLFFQSNSVNHSAPWYRSMMVEMEIVGQNVSAQVHHTVFSSTGISVDDSEESREFYEQCDNLLRDDNEYRAYIDRELLRLWPEYKLYMLRGLGAVAPTANPHLLLHSAYGLLKGPDNALLHNNFQCESHCWAISRILKYMGAQKK